MRNIALFLIVVPLVSVAGPKQNWWTPTTPSVRYLDKALCPDECYPIVRDDGYVIDPFLSGVSTLPDGSHKLVEDTVKRAAQDKAAADAQAADQTIKQKTKQMSQGQAVIAKFRILNEAKSLTQAQRVQLLRDQAVKDIQSALLVGSLDVARGLIQAMVINEPLITQNDKDVLSALIDSFP